MPKNKIGGNKAKKNKNTPITKKRELIFAEDKEIYGIILELCGNSRMKVYCSDEIERVCSIRGNMRKKIWMKKNDYVLISIREFEKNKGDIIYKYNSEEVISLYNYNELDQYMKQKELHTLGYNNNINETEEFIEFNDNIEEQEFNEDLIDDI
jgi:translation initiation factor 1A